MNLGTRAFVNRAVIQKIVAPVDGSGVLIGGSKVKCIRQNLKGRLVPQNGGDAGMTRRQVCEFQRFNLNRDVSRRYVKFVPVYFALRLRSAIHLLNLTADMSIGSLWPHWKARKEVLGRNPRASSLREMGHYSLRHTLHHGHWWESWTCKGVSKCLPVSCVSAGHRDSKC